MVTKKPRNAVAPADRPFQYDDIDVQGRQALGGAMKDWGNAKTNLGKSRSTTFAALQSATARSLSSTDQSSTDVAQRSMSKHVRAGDRLDLIEPHLRDAKVDLNTAANARVGLARDSVKRSAADGSTAPLRDAGAGWYFEHRAALNETAAKHGLPEEHVVAASAVMSPLNSPANERQAVSSLAHLHAQNPTLKFDPKVRQSLGIKRASVKYGDLTVEQASQIGSPQHREGIKGVDQEILRGVASGGPQGNVQKAIGVLRGHVKPDEAIDPHTSAKVWSYHNATKNATPGGAVHEEYLTRAQTALHEMPGQGTMDLFGLRHSTEGILNPRGHTAEDTWMNAVSSGQPLQGVEGGRHLISPAKVVGSEKSFTDTPKVQTVNDEKVSIHPSPRATKENMRHAWNNEATARASQQLSAGTDVQVPAVLTQETSWTEARRVAGKDPEYNVARGGSVKPQKKILRPANKGQGRLF